MNTKLLIWFLSGFAALFSSTIFAITIDSAYIDHYRLAEIGATPCAGCGKLSEESSRTQTYSAPAQDSFSASTSASAYSNIGANSVSASAGGWLNASLESGTDNYVLEGRASVYLFDWQSDFNTSSYGQTIFNQWLDFTVPESQSYQVQTQMVQQLTDPDLIIDYFMETNLFVVDTGEVIFSSNTDNYSDSYFSLSKYTGQTLRFQTTGEIEAFMPQNIGTTNSGAAFTIDSRLYLQAVPVPASTWLFASGLIGLIGLTKKTGADKLKEPLINKTAKKSQPQ